MACGPRVPVHRLCHVVGFDRHQRDRLCPVVGELGDVLGGLGAVTGFESLGYPAMQTHPPGGAELVVEGVADERVREAEAPRRQCELAHQSRGDGRLEGFEVLVFGRAAHVAQHGQVEVAADDRGHGQGALGGLGQAGDAAPDDLAHADGNAQVGDVADIGPAAVLFKHGARLGEVAQELAHEEGAAVGLAVHGMGEGDTAVAQVVTGHGLEERRDVDVLEAAQCDARDARFPAQVGEHLDKRVAVREVAVAVGAHQKQRHGCGRAHQVAQQQQARLVGPVQVVEQQEHRGSA